MNATKKLCALAFIAAAAALAGHALADESSKTYAPEDFKVYIDKPTGYAFIKTPTGWKFIRKIEGKGDAGYKNPAAKKP